MCVCVQAIVCSALCVNSFMYTRCTCSLACGGIELDCHTIRLMECARAYACTKCAADFVLSVRVRVGECERNELRVRSNTHLFAHHYTVPNPMNTQSSEHGLIKSRSEAGARARARGLRITISITAIRARAQYTRSAHYMQILSTEIRCPLCSNGHCGWSQYSHVYHNMQQQRQQSCSQYVRWPMFGAHATTGENA